MEKQWFYVSSGQQQGPISSDQLKELAVSGQLVPTDMVWQEGTADWVSASTVENLFPTKVENVPPPLPQSIPPAAPPAIQPPPLPASEPQNDVSARQSCLGCGCLGFIFLMICGMIGSCIDGGTVSIDEGTVSTGKKVKLPFKVDVDNPPITFAIQDPDPSTLPYGASAKDRYDLFVQNNGNTSLDCQCTVKNDNGKTQTIKFVIPPYGKRFSLFTTSEIEDDTRHWTFDSGQQIEIKANGYPKIVQKY